MKHLTLIDYYLIFQIKYICRVEDNIWPYHILYLKKYLKSHAKIRLSSPETKDKLELPEDHILYLIFQIILSASFKNMNQQLITHQKEYI